ncbi:MAG: SDR family NAD(P)-dependent oxidoreductase [Acidobacteriota bacterium]|nr:SDR family NAD(P)-dependent oxidoreductase [Acidobacteriota bacterium]
MDGQVAVVTGANSGIGRETAHGLASLGATVVLACRNAERAAGAVAELRRRGVAGELDTVALDLADLSSVEACAGELTGRFDRLDVLVNNAGGIWSSRQVTAQGFEQTIGVNHLGPYLLTRLLLGRLVASAPSRIVNLSSVGHHFAAFGMRFEDLQSERAYVSLEAYARSKLANLLFTRELARRLAGRAVVVHAAHPGAVRSGFGMDGDLGGVQGIGNRVVRAFEITPEAGARTPVFLASSPEAARSTGGYWVRRRPGHASRRARSDAAAARLWQVSEELLAGAGHPAPPMPS